MWAKRLLIGSGFAVASLIAVPAVAGATPSCGSTTGITCTTPTAPPTVAGNTGSVVPTSQLPNTGAANAGVASPTVSPTTSLPFTGADVEGLAVIGIGAVVAGGLLMRRRRHTLPA
jgi:LPXTG-motif cell wall-anchored protein